MVKVSLNHTDEVHELVTVNGKQLYSDNTKRIFIRYYQRGFCPSGRLQKDSLMGIGYQDAAKKIQRADRRQTNSNAKMRVVSINLGYFKEIRFSTTMKSFPSVTKITRS
jgi:hypothetical protein